MCVLCSSGFWGLSGQREGLVCTYIWLCGNTRGAEKRRVYVSDVSIARKSPAQDDKTKLCIFRHTHTFTRVQKVGADLHNHHLAYRWQLSCCTGATGNQFNGVLWGLSHIGSCIKRGILTNAVVMVTWVFGQTVLKCCCNVLAEGTKPNFNHGCVFCFCLYSFRTAHRALLYCVAAKQKSRSNWSSSRAHCASCRLFFFFFFHSGNFIISTTALQVSGWSKPNPLNVFWEWGYSASLLINIFFLNVRLTFCEKKVDLLLDRSLSDIWNPNQSKFCVSTFSREKD